MTIAPHSQGRKLLAFAHGLSLSDVPLDVIDRAKLCLLDALGCGLFGSTQPWSQILAAEMTAEASLGHSTVIGHPQLLAAPAAALCNGTAIHGFELDDLIGASIIHPAASVIPAALAAAERADASGLRLIEAIVAGYEVMHRLSLALGNEPAKRGFHSTSLVAPAACAVAAGKILQLSLDQLSSAVGLACSSAAGIKKLCRGPRRRHGQAASSRACRGGGRPRRATGTTRFPWAAISDRQPLRPPRSLRRRRSAAGKAHRRDRTALGDARRLVQSVSDLRLDPVRGEPADGYARPRAAQARGCSLGPDRGQPIRGEE